MSDSEQEEVNKLNNPIVKKFILIFIPVVLFINSIQPFFTLIRQLPQDVNVILTKSIEQVKIREYGRCNAIGYGYIKKIVSSIPDKKVFPVVRYNSFDLFPHILFSDSRLGYNDNILIGIDLGPEATNESVITNSKLTSVDPSHSRSQWVFHTILDYEILSGFIFYFKDNIPLPERTLTVSLYDSDINFVEIGHWVIPLSNQQKSPLVFSLKKPIRRFSIGRGVTDFILVIDGPDINTPPAMEITDILVLGTKLDLSDYMIFNRGQANYERCFAAIKKMFYQEIYQNNLVEWEKYLKEISNVHPLK